MRILIHIKKEVGRLLEIRMFCLARSIRAETHKERITIRSLRGSMWNNRIEDEGREVGQDTISRREVNIRRKDDVDHRGVTGRDIESRSAERGGKRAINICLGWFCELFLFQRIG